MTCCSNGELIIKFSSEDLDVIIIECSNCKTSYKYCLEEENVKLSDYYEDECKQCGDIIKNYKCGSYYCKVDNNYCGCITTKTGYTIECCDEPCSSSNKYRYFRCKRCDKEIEIN